VNEDNTFWISIMFMSAMFALISYYFKDVWGFILFGYIYAYSANKQLKIIRNGRKSWWYEDS